MKPFLRSLSFTRATLLLFAVLAASGLTLLTAQEFRLTSIQRTLEGKVSLQFPSDPNFYYVLFRGETVTTITTPVAMSLGVAGQGVLVEAAKAGSGAFYRARTVPVAHTGDAGRGNIHRLQD